MIINRSTFAGAVVALLGQFLAFALFDGVAILVGGGPHAGLDAGGRGAAAFFGLIGYGALQLLLLGVCTTASRRLGPGSTAGLTLGWLLGLAGAMYYMGGGFGA